MDKCVLIKPDVSFESDIQAFRNEMLYADSSMDGTGPLKRMNNIKGCLLIALIFVDYTVLRRFW